MFISCGIQIDLNRRLGIEPRNLVERKIALRVRTAAECEQAADEPMPNQIYVPSS